MNSAAVTAAIGVRATKSLSSELNFSRNDVKMPWGDFVSNLAILRELGGLPEAQAALVVEIAKSQNRLFGATEGFLVTRELRASATREECRQLLDCLCAVSAADAFNVVPLGSSTVFTVTVKNIGTVPIRTKGPEPGFVYSTSQNYSTVEQFEEPGVWRLGVDSEGNSIGRQYPYRWQLGASNELKHVTVDGKILSRHTANAILKQAGLEKQF